MVDIRSEFERVRGVKSLGQSRSARYIFRQKAVWVTSESGDGRAEKPRYDLPQGVSVKNRYEADLINQLRGSGSKIYVYSAVPHGGAEWLRYTVFCLLPLIFSGPASYLLSTTSLFLLRAASSFWTKILRTFGFKTHISKALMIIFPTISICVSSPENTQPRPHRHSGRKY